jgi:hypothetical protein
MNGIWLVAWMAIWCIIRFQAVEVFYQRNSGVPGQLDMVSGGPQIYEENNVIASIGESYCENWDGAINENSRNLLMFQKNRETGKHRDRV